MTQKNLFRNKGRKKIVDNKTSFIDMQVLLLFFFTTFLHDKDTAIFSRFDEEQTLHIFYHVL